MNVAVKGDVGRGGLCREGGQGTRLRASEFQLSCVTLLQPFGESPCEIRSVEDSILNLSQFGGKNTMTDGLIFPRRHNDEGEGGGQRSLP